MLFASWQRELLSLFPPPITLATVLGRNFVPTIATFRLYPESACARGFSLKFWLLTLRAESGMDIALWIVALVAAALLAGILYQHIAGWRDGRRYAAGGRTVRLRNGCTLHAVQQGSGSPAVVFEAGIGATSVNWRHIQEAIAQSARTISYDRAGLGWSGPCRTARTPANVAAELHEMLQQAGVRPPLILVGHSFGGLVMRRYALLHPEDVAGLVLVDPMRCEEWPPFVPARQSQLDIARGLCTCAIPIAACGLARLGLSSLLCGSGKVAQRLAGIAGENCRYVLKRIKNEVAKMPREIPPMVVASWSRPEFYAGMRSHLEAIPESVTEMQDAEPIRGIPILLLTPGKSAPLDDASLGRIGDHVRQVIAAASEHWIHFDEPALVIDSIREMVTAAAAQCVTSLQQPASIL